MHIHQFWKFQDIFKIVKNLKRTEHCDVEFPVMNYRDYLGFNVDLNQKTISWETLLAKK